MNTPQRSRDLLNTFKSRLFHSKIVEFYRHLGEDASLPTLDPSPHTDFEKLREALSGRQELLTVVTHELKTPLTSMRLMLQMLERITRTRESISSEELGRLLKPAQRQVDRLTKLVDNLLDLSRLQHEHRLDLDIEQFDLSETLREVAQRLKSQAEWTGSVIHVEDTGPVVGLWDRLRLEQIVTNLTTNAIKYGEGKPIILSAQDRHSHVEIRIEDHGIGISEADQQRIFKRFEPITRDHETQSLGLGLFIVHEIVAAHGGSIELESKLGVGTVFKIQLPKEFKTNGPLQ